MSYLEILERELKYQERVYKGKTDRYRELLIEYRLYKCFLAIVNDIFKLCLLNKKTLNFHFWQEILKNLIFI